MSRAVLLETPAVPHLVNKFPIFYGTRIFITEFTTARQISPVHALPPCFFKTNFNITLPPMPMSPTRYLSFAFPHQHSTRSYPLPIHATCPAHLIFHISTPSLQTYITNRITLIGFAQELAEFRCAASISKNGNYKNDVLNLLTIVSRWKSKKLS
jgi:hypothetical protein